jgi:hypothetical protein
MVEPCRGLKIELTEGQSAFLRGPRKTGKSTSLRAAFSGALYYDFLKSDLVLEHSRRPSLLRERLEALPAGAVLLHPRILAEREDSRRNLGLRGAPVGQMQGARREGAGAYMGGR